MKPLASSFLGRGKREVQTAENRPDAGVSSNWRKKWLRFGPTWD